jgi:glutamate-1-semialdehyde aminotransferase
VFNEGVDTQGGRIWRTSAAHTETDIDVTIEAVERAVMAMREEGVLQPA